MPARFLTASDATAGSRAGLRCIVCAPPSPCVRSPRRPGSDRLSSDRERLSQAGALAGEECLRHTSFRSDHIEAVEGARHDFDVARYTGGFEPVGVGEVLVMEHVASSDADPCRWQAGEIL